MWVIGNGWGQSWAIFLATASDFATLLQHLRQFVFVTTEVSDQERCFRFCDPRVLKVFIPTGTHQETAEFFGLIRFFSQKVSHHLRSAYPDKLEMIFVIDTSSRQFYKISLLRYPPIGHWKNDAPKDA
jgi:hypothetical protein